MKKEYCQKNTGEGECFSDRLVLLDWDKIPKILHLPQYFVSGFNNF